MWAFYQNFEHNWNSQLCQIQEQYAVNKYIVVWNKGLIHTVNRR